MQSGGENNWVNICNDKQRVTLKKFPGEANGISGIRELQKNENYCILCVWTDNTETIVPLLSEGQDITSLTDLGYHK